MIISPSKMRRHKILKNRTINFETVRRTHGNLILIPTDDYKDFNDILKSRLFRPQQLICAFTPRIIKPMNRKIVRVNQKEIYAEIKNETNNRIKMGRAVSTSYAGKNLVYNTLPVYNETLKLASTVKPSPLALQNFMREYSETLYSSTADEINYEKNYIVFPMIKFIPDMRKKIYSVYPDETSPLILFLKSLKKGSMDFSKFTDINEIIFYNPNAEALFVIDLKDPDFEKEIDQDLVKILRLNNFNNGTDSLEGDEDVEVEAALDNDSRIENNKEIIKNIVLGNIATKLKTDKLDDFEPSTKDEENLILTIDRKVQSYLDKPENLTKKLDDLIVDIESDQEIKSKAINYIENKKVSLQKAGKFSESIEKENDIINSILDQIPEGDNLEADEFEVEGIPEKIKKSKLSSLDEQYNIKQAKKDLVSIMTSFSSSEFIPMSLESLDISDTSDDFDQKETVFAKYKTDDGKNLSFSLDIPKVVDKKYLYLGGNKKAITKQLMRLPIVKTKTDRVEIATNYNKITIERTNGKLSRGNSFLSKILSEYKDSKNVDVRLGSNSIINAEYVNDFEYEELADSISSIKTHEYTLIFNRKSMAEELALLPFEDSFYEDTMTPFGIVNDKNAFVYMMDNEIYLAAEEEGEVKTEHISETLFDFITQDVLKRTHIDKTPTIGKSFIYTKMKIIGVWYPIFVVIGLNNGMTNILKRYDIETRVSDTRMSLPGFVEIKFKNSYLYYKDTLKNTLLLNILYLMDTESFDREDFDLDAPYIDFLRDKLGQPQYVKNTLKLNLNLVIDPITKDVLRDLKMPENITDLLLLGNTMLTHNSYRAQNDIRNYRVRGNELVYAIMYEMMAKAYLSYQTGKMNGKGTDSIELGFKANGKKIKGQRSLLVRILMEPNVNDHSTLNPVLEIESSAAVSQKGFRGVNLNAAYTLELRTYDESMAGVLSGNATPYSGSAGITRSLTYNPRISTIRGYIEEKSLGSMTASDLLSPTEMLSAFTSTMADPPRLQTPGAV